LNLKKNRCPIQISWSIAWIGVCYIGRGFVVLALSHQGKIANFLFRFQKASQKSSRRCLLDTKHLLGNSNGQVQIHFKEDRMKKISALILLNLTLSFAAHAQTTLELVQGARSMTPSERKSRWRAKTVS
jgi:hypothetical protein